jgi:hypothetical protein
LKDIKVDSVWLYIRAEFPQEFTPYIDILLQYVKNYEFTMKFEFSRIVFANYTLNFGESTINKG